MSRITTSGEPGKRRAFSVYRDACTRVAVFCQVGPELQACNLTERQLLCRVAPLVKAPTSCRAALQCTDAAQQVALCVAWR